MPAEDQRGHALRLPRQDQLLYPWQAMQALREIIDTSAHLQMVAGREMVA
ncbi:MAG: hypothetical protein M3Z20_04335 [Chloroflexota bacterium]|nr:hypothetical protein [Chloroflexota bacterium]